MGWALAQGSSPKSQKREPREHVPVTLTPSGKRSCINLCVTDVSRMKTSRLKIPCWGEKTRDRAAELRDPSWLHRRDLKTECKPLCFSTMELLQYFTSFLWECSFKVLLPSAKFLKQTYKDHRGLFSVSVMKKSPYYQSFTVEEIIILKLLLVVVFDLTLKEVSCFREYFE